MYAGATDKPVQQLVHVHQEWQELEGMVRVSVCAYLMLDFLSFPRSSTPSRARALSLSSSLSLARSRSLALSVFSTCVPATSVQWTCRHARPTVHDRPAAPHLSPVPSRPLAFTIVSACIPPHTSYASAKPCGNELTISRLSSTRFRLQCSASPLRNCPRPQLPRQG